jgi:peptidylprolyl isomerase
VLDRVRSTVRPLGGLALVVALVIGCAGTDEPATDQGEAVAADDVDLGTKPDAVAQLPDDRSAPPTTLEAADLVEGEGEQATAGATVEVHYVGVDYVSGEQFDASWDRGQTFDFPLGAGRVIQGWDQGVEGMRVGGRRVLTIPPDLAYGAQGAGGVIGPNATLVFVVDLIGVDAPAS